MAGFWISTEVCLQHCLIHGWLHVNSEAAALLTHVLCSRYNSAHITYSFRYAMQISYVPVIISGQGLRLSPVDFIHPYHLKLILVVVFVCLWGYFYLFIFLWGVGGRCGDFVHFNCKMLMLIKMHILGPLHTGHTPWNKMKLGHVLIKITPHNTAWLWFYCRWHLRKDRTSYVLCGIVTASNSTNCKKKQGISDQHVCAGVVCKEYNILTLELLFLMFQCIIFDDLVKRDVPTLVGKIQRYRNDGYYY